MSGSPLPPLALMTDQAPPKPGRAAFAFIFVTVMLDMLALGMIIPVLPLLIETFRGGDTASAARIVRPGGTVGLALLLHYTTGVAVGAALFVVNLPFYALAWKRMGRRFTLKTIAAVTLLAGCASTPTPSAAAPR